MFDSVEMRFTAAENFSLYSPDTPNRIYTKYLWLEIVRQLLTPQAHLLHFALQSRRKLLILQAAIVAGDKS